MGASGEMAVVRFAAFAAGVSVGEVSMVGGVHVLAGNERTVAAEEERVVAQRDERGERRERREQRRAAEQREATSEPCASDPTPAQASPPPAAPPPDAPASRSCVAQPPTRFSKREAVEFVIDWWRSRRRREA